MKTNYGLAQTGCRLADAWGRGLIFWPRWDPDTGKPEFWIISQGPDADCEWTLNGDFFDYDPRAPKNRDNIVRVIRHNEWYEHNVGRKIEQTRRTMESIRIAVVGPADRFDSNALAIIGGYVADFGAFPDLYKWVEGPPPGWRKVEGPGDWGQPRALWTRDLDGDGTVSPSENATLSLYCEGYGWRGPYYRDEVGLPGTEGINDAWATPIEFTLKDYDLWMTSLGRDRVAGSDDITMVIERKSFGPSQEERTRRILAEIKFAIVRQQDGVVSGFLVDMGRLPCLYEWDNSTRAWSYRYTGTEKQRWNVNLNKWEYDSAMPTRELTSVVPAELWTRNPIGHFELPAYADGAGWRMGYLDEPPGAEGTKLLRDGRMQPLRYVLTSDAITITSDSAEVDPNLRPTVNVLDWQSTGQIVISLAGTEDRASVMYPNIGELAYTKPLSISEPSGRLSLDGFSVLAGLRTVVIWNETAGDPDRPDQETPRKLVLKLLPGIGSYTLDFGP